MCYQEFHLCAQWVQLYPVSEQSQLQLQTEHLLHLLENGQTEDAFQVQECVRKRCANVLTETSQAEH